MNKDLHASYKYRLQKYCDAKKILDSSLYPERFTIDEGTCWLCWMRLTGQELRGWRKKPFYELELTHGKKCPACGYTHWTGATWFPFKYLEEKGKILVGNPSFRRIKSAK